MLKNITVKVPNTKKFCAIILCIIPLILYTWYILFDKGLWIELPMHLAMQEFGLIPSMLSLYYVHIHGQNLSHDFGVDLNSYATSWTNLNNASTYRIEQPTTKLAPEIAQDLLPF